MGWWCKCRLIKSDKTICYDLNSAEGVETDDQLAWVRALGVTEVQGYFTGRPLPFSETVALLAAESGKQAAA